MNQVKLNKVNANDAVQEPLKAEMQLSTRQESELVELTQWETALASGGEAVVCW